MENYGLILKQLRNLSGYSQKVAAQKIGKSAGWLSEIENGHGNSRLHQKEFERIVTLFDGDKHKELFKTRVASEKTKDKTDRTLDGAILKHIREKRELSLAQASEKIGISLKYLSNLEIGRRPVSLQLKDQIMRAYGYTPSSFRNFSRDEKRSKAVPTRYKIISLLNQLEESDLQPILDLTAKILATPKTPLDFLKDVDSQEV